ncbi:MAG: hypothetical protein KJZ86_06885 [Caldilineaceae bacterium]|nr:hypothetical protein [Caldilineaceae bacterium]
MRRISHHPIIPLLLLFVSFRLLALLLLRPGGFVADFSDYDFYRVWGQLTPAGYAAYDNLWTAYPPLFPGLMLWIFELSARIPPWVDPRLSFHTLFGLALLLFETGNLILLYRLAEKIGERGLGSGERGLGTGEWGLGGSASLSDTRLSPPHPVTLSPCHPVTLSPPHPVTPSPCHPVTPSPLDPVILYALLFTPVYTLLGWFESMPLFFMLLGLDLLLSGRGRPWGWLLSAVAAGLGFLVKLTPALLAPVAVGWLGARLSWKAARQEWFNRASQGNLLRPALYTLLFAATVVGVGLPLVWRNPALALSSLRVQSIRPPWESIWALLDGYYGYGLVPLDMRNLAGLDGPLWQSSLPWGVISLGFGLLYLWLYTRPYDWQRPRTAVAFAGFSVIWLFLYSKGWSPQFVVWVLAFLVLLLSNLRGVAIAVGLMTSNVIESHLYLILLPGESWLLWGTVLFRTALLVLLAVDFLGQVWPGKTGQRATRWSARLSWAVLTAGVLAVLLSAPAAGRAYAASRLAAHPCREAVELLQAEAEWPERLVVTEEAALWEQFYPWLRQRYDLRIVDDYQPDQDPAQVASQRLGRLAVDSPAFWFVDSLDAPGHTIPFFEKPSVSVLSTQILGECRLRRVWAGEGPRLASAQVEGGPIDLLGVQLDESQKGGLLHLVVYWQAEAPVSLSYTVFAQVLDDAGRLVAQQDNLPVAGLAPTNTWQPGVVIRDPYRIALPAGTPPGHYELIVGLYTAAGRVSLDIGQDETGEFIRIPVTITEP